MRSPIRGGCLALALAGSLAGQSAFRPGDPRAGLDWGAIPESPARTGLATARLFDARVALEAWVALRGPDEDRSLLGPLRPDLAAADPELARRGRERADRELAALAAEVRGAGVVALQSDLLIGARHPDRIELAGLVGRPTLDRWLALRDPFRPGAATELVLPDWIRMPRRIPAGPVPGGVLVAYLWVGLEEATLADAADPGRRRIRGRIRAAALADRPGGRVVALLEPEVPPLHPGTEAVLARLAAGTEAVRLTVLQARTLPGPGADPAWLEREDQLDRLRLLVSDLAAACGRITPGGTRTAGPGQPEGLEVEGFGRRVVLRLDQLFGAASPGGRTTSFRGERELAARLEDLLAARRPGIYFVEGHGEAPLGSDGPDGLSHLARELEGSDYAVGAFDLGAGAALPDDAAALVLAGPRTELEPPELARLESWLEARRPLLVMLEPAGSFAGLRGLLRRRGVDLVPNLAFEPDAAYAHADHPFAARPGLNQHAITALARSRGEGVTLRQAMGLEPFFPSRVGYDVRTLLQSSPTAWGETRIAGERVELGEDPEDLAPPLSLAFAVSSRAGSNDGLGLAGRDELRLVVVGDADWVSNRWLGADPGHRGLFLEALRWVLRKDVTSAVPAMPLDGP